MLRGILLSIGSESIKRVIHNSNQQRTSRNDTEGFLDYKIV